MLKIHDLSFSYNNNLILSNISFNCKENEFISFIGPSGCGKTTLLNVIANILKPNSGIIDNPFNRISYVFQQDALLPWLNVLQNILLPLEIKNNKLTNDDKIKATKILGELGLHDIDYLYPSELSGGMKKRVELARALIIEPELLILDEPFSSLDILTRERLNVLLKNICISRSLAVILVTHSIEEACFLSDRIYVLSEKPSKILEIFDNNKNKQNIDFFVLNKDEEDTETKIRTIVSQLWINKSDEKPVHKKIKRKIESDVIFEKNENKNRKIKSYFKDESKTVDEKKLIYNLLVPFEIIFLLIIIEIIKKKTNISDFFLPAPSSILKRFLDTINSRLIFPHIFQTMFESLSGFSIAFILSIISGYLLSRSKIIYKIVMPYLIAFNTIPSIALVPFLILWFGFSIVPKIIISVIIIFFPMLINNITAFSQIQNQYRGLLLFYKPNFRQRFSKIELPGSLLYVFAGVKVSITLSIIGAVVGEFQAGSVGLGSLILIAKANFDIELMFVGLIWLILLGLSYFWLASFIYKLITKKKINK